MSRETDRRTTLRTTLTTERARLAAMILVDFATGTPLERISQTAGDIAEIDARIVVLDALVIA